MSEFALMATVAIVGIIGIVSIVAIVFGQHLKSRYGKFRMQVGQPRHKDL